MPAVVCSLSASAAAVSAASGRVSQSRYDSRDAISYDVSGATLRPAGGAPPGLSRYTNCGAISMACSVTATAVA